MAEQDLQTSSGQQQPAAYANSTEEAPIEEPYQITVKLPSGKLSEVKILAGPRESIHDIKQSLMESPRTCAYSCFYLSFKGKSVNDYLELGEIEGIAADSELHLVEKNYTERDARLHIMRLRDLLAGPYKQSATSVGIDPSLSFLTAVTGKIDEEFIAEGDKPMEDMFSTEPIPQHAFTNVNVEAPSMLSNFVPTSFQRISSPCLKTITLSGWNPVTHSRRLAGDLLYLDVVTLENETLNITSSTTGFFVNNSTPTEFNPHPRSGKKRAHSLIHLLQSISPQFAAHFVTVQDFITKHHMLEVLPVNTYLPSYPWAVQPTQPTFDPARPAESYLNYGVDAVDSLRDWNDELQSNRELPKSNLQERVLRERLITKVQSEFTDAAVRGAMAVATGSLPPLNPMDPEASHMYTFNNIFFSKSNDGRGIFDHLGADEAAHVAIGKDLEGVKILNNLDLDGLYTLSSVVVDYKGIRVVAQSIVPGIFHRHSAEHCIVYGSTDNGTTIMADTPFHDSIEKNVAKPLHLSEHDLVDGKGELTKLYTSLETKGLLGADGRRYLLDLYRLNPVDIEFQDSACVATDDSPAYPHKMTLLRPELLNMYWEHMFRHWYKAKVDSIRKERDGAATEIVEDQEKKGNGKPEAQDDITQQQQQQQQQQDETIDIDVNEFKLSFNPDVFTDVKQGGDIAQIKEQEQVVRAVSRFLNDEVIPSLVLDFASYTISPLDGDALTKAMHRRGINMRYLGKVASLVSISEDKRIHHIHALAIQEMVVRTSKRLLRNYMATLDLEISRLCLSHYLNCLFGGAVNARPVPVLPSGKTKNDYSWAHLSPPTLKKLIKDQVLARFRYSITDDDWSQLKPIPTLREVCQRSGIQLEARDYRFAAYTPEELAANAAADAQLESALSRHHSQLQKSSRKSKKHQQTAGTLMAALPRRKTTFIPEDIMNILPTVKQALSRSAFAEETFEAGKMSLVQGNRELGLELLLESLTLHEQTYGFLHPETSKCYATLAMIYHHAEERENALDLQRKAVVAAERTLGVDHPETLHHYLNLGLFEHASGRSKLALRYVRHALYYWDLLFGPGHPDSATADNNAGVMLQSLRDYKTGVKFFERACTTQENIFGKDHVLTASGYHVLAKSYTLLGEFNKALSVERVAYGVFEKKLGKDDPRTKESDTWLKELTSNALLTAQQARESRQEHHQPIPRQSEKTKRSTNKLADSTEGDLSINHANSESTGSSRKNGKKSSQNRR